jgi:hypothetical protein
MYPPLPERFEWHMNDRRFLNWLIDSLRTVYEETPSEKVMEIINRLTSVKDRGEALEEAARKQELTEALKMIGELPEVQPQWLLYYRDKDLE